MAEMRSEAHEIVRGLLSDALVISAGLAREDLTAAADREFLVTIGVLAIIVCLTLFAVVAGVERFVSGPVVALERAEERIRTVIEAAPVGLVMVDASGVITLANGQMARMFGHPREELLGQRIEQLLPKRYLAGHPGLRAGFLASPRARSMGTGRDLFGLRKDGIEFPVEVGLNPVDTPDGRAVLASVIDITDRKGLEDAVHAANAQLEAANKELEGFSYSVSHDLRSPLRAVDGYALILEEDYAASFDDEGRRLLAVVRAEAARMGRLIDDLLAFSRTGRQPLRAAPVDMAALAREALAEMSTQYPATSIEVLELPQAWGDRALLRQVWANLISNALKYSAKNPAPRVEIGGRANPDEVEYWARDNGVGFDPRYADKLFRVFQRLHRPEDFPGTGVGLALVQRIVLRHGGRVWAESEPNEGARIGFALPAKRS